MTLYKQTKVMLKDLFKTIEDPTPQQITALDSLSDIREFKPH
jgi:hypothetical protein